MDFAPYVLKFEEYKGFVRNAHLANANTKILRTIVSRQVIFLHISVLQLFWFPKGASWPPDPKATYNVLTSGCSNYSGLSLEQLDLLQETHLSPGPTCWLISRLLTYCPVLYFGSILKNSPLRKCILNLFRLLWLRCHPPGGIHAVNSFCHFSAYLEMKWFATINRELILTH